MPEKEDKPTGVKSRLVKVKDGQEKYHCLMFVCPGCLAAGQGTGLHMLPVNCTNHEPSWNFDGNEEAPTLSPSILTTSSVSGAQTRCHSFLEHGLFRFLGDSTHSLAGQTGVPLPDLPQWALDEDDVEEDKTQGPR